MYYMAVVVKPLVIANWKMNLSIRQSVSLARALVTGLAPRRGHLAAEVVLCPSFPALAAVAGVLKGKPLTLGAQNVFWKAKGPYTGEVSAEVLKELGVRYVMVGHSERRQYLRETDAMVQQKVAAVLQAGLTPVVCVGETFAERQIGQKDVVIDRQVTAALKGLTLEPDDHLVVAYEPVWVIGSGQAVEPEEAMATAKVIRQALIDVWPERAWQSQVRIIYGGSVDSSNIKTFLGGELTGVLVGGASLEAKTLLALVRELA